MSVILLNYQNPRTAAGLPEGLYTLESIVWELLRCAADFIEPGSKLGGLPVTPEKRALAHDRHQPAA